MNAFKFIPEGWNNEITKLNEANLREYIQNQDTVQGLVKECDDNYNLYINFDNNLKGIIPRKEVEGINIQEDGLPKTNLCTGKVHKFVQFKVKDIDEKNYLILNVLCFQKTASMLDAVHYPSCVYSS